jgi:hypothetical protein
MPTSTAISIDRKEDIVAVLIATFLERHWMHLIVR